MTEPTMDSIERSARIYAEKRTALADTVASLEADIAALKRQRLPVIRRQVAAAAAAEDALRAEIAAAPDLFAKPKTRILHGIKVGYAKAKGRLTYYSAASCVKMIRRHFPDRFDELVKVTETPIKAALSRLSGTDLKKLGARLEETGDTVVISPADSEIDKLVDALLGAATDEAEAA